MKIRLDARDCWIIRRTQHGFCDYMETVDVWTSSPALAAIFRTFEAAEHELWLARNEGRVSRDEILDVVPLYGALVRQA
ncbi:MAG: hypothetical protein ACM31O_03710 [Bacteroidota bacterium]